MNEDLLKRVESMCESHVQRAETVRLVLTFLSTVAGFVVSYSLRSSDSVGWLPYVGTALFSGGGVWYLSSWMVEKARYRALHLELLANRRD